MKASILILSLVLLGAAVNAAETMPVLMPTGVELEVRCPEVGQASKLPCGDQSSCSTKLMEMEKAHEICMQRLKPPPQLAIPSQTN